MNGRIEPENIDLFIVNYLRHNEVRSSVSQWLESFPFESVNIIDNHGSLSLDVFREEDRDKIKIFHNVRPSWMLGSLAQCWNLAYCHSLGKKDWIVCSQDDVLIQPGWDKVVDESGFATYFAPKGDMVHINSIEGFRLYKWWDERFRTIFYQESDYMLRAIKYVPECISICDHHHWSLKHNDVGLDNFFSASERTDEVKETGDIAATKSGEALGEMWASKWGKSPYEIFTLHQFPECKWIPENVDWYPSATYEWQKQGRI
jgi:hypothetical protein